MRGSGRSIHPAGTTRKQISLLLQLQEGEFSSSDRLRRARSTEGRPSLLGPKNGTADWLDEESVSGDDDWRLEGDFCATSINEEHFTTRLKVAVKDGLTAEERSSLPATSSLGHSPRR